jgi:hypothetical protein
MWLPILPGSTTQFTATVRSDTQRCYLRQLNLVRFPELAINPYIINISFPYWLEQADLEVWQYGENIDGSYTPPSSDFEALTQAVNRIETTVGFIANRDVTTTYDVEPE